MSTATAEGINARRYLTAWLGALTPMTVKDIRQIPNAKWTETFGGCTRPANELLADTITMLRWMTDTIEGKASDAYDRMAALTAAVADRDYGIAAFEEASDALAKAITDASDETLNSTIMAPWQMPTPMFMLAHIAVSHIWYHDGQFNYIHCLLGDSSIHWMTD